MCGIFGWVGAKDDTERQYAPAMLESLRRRGPDGGAVETPAPGVLLGHTRLAIVDLTPAARQPLRNETGDVWAVVNGEIYNQLGLRRDLERAGHRFLSRGDSEVVRIGEQNRHRQATFSLIVEERLAGVGIAINPKCSRNQMFFRDGRDVSHFQRSMGAVVACIKR